MRHVVLLTLGITLALALVSGSARAERVQDVKANARPSLLNDVIPSPCPGPQCTAELQEPYALGKRYVYLSFDGVTLTRSTTNEDARSNISAIVNSATEVIPAFDTYDLSSTGGMTRQQIITYVVNGLYDLYDAFDVEFTTTRPSSGNYHMIVFGGTSYSVFGENGAAGVSLGDCEDTMANNILFVFPSGQRVGDLVTTAAHELGHSFGLSHIDDNDAIMYYAIQSLIPDHFGAGNVWPDGPVCPGQTYQNSPDQLMGVIGPRGQDVSPPTVTITTPVANANVFQGDPIRATASDPSGIDYLEASIDGAVIATDNSAPYEWTIPLTAPAGEHSLRVRAYDNLGNDAFHQIAINIQAGEAPPCESKDDCDPGEICDANGDCVPEFGDGELGAPCIDETSCMSPLFCGAVGDEKRCTQGCDAASPCPEGFDCIGACWPAGGDDGDDGGGGCFGSVSKSTDTRPALVPFLLLLCGLFFAFRRRS